MNEALMNNAKELLNVIITDAIAVRDFIISETPDVIQQLLAWNMTYSLVRLAVSILIFVCFAIGLFHHIRWIARHFNDADENLIISNILCVATYSIPSVIATIVFFNLTWLQIIVAPKIYLIEYAANMAK
jgi:hypothetical protein